MVGGLFANEIDRALKLAQQGKFEDAIDIIMPLANNDNSEAQYWLARFYGPRGINNKEENVKWLFKAVENGSADAQYWLANTFLELNNLEEYKELLYRAANNNHPQAQYDIAWSMSEGWLDASIETLVEIIYWYEKSGHNGNANAYTNLSVMYDKENRNVLSEMKKVANDGNAMAQYNMGWIYARGLLIDEGLMQDMDIAKVWFEKSAALRFEDAKIILEKNFSEQIAEEADESDESLKDFLEFVQSLSEFTVDENEKGYMIYNDWPYPDLFNPIDHLSTTIIKFKGQDRPILITFTLSPIVDVNMGLSIFWSKIVNGDLVIEPFTIINHSFDVITDEYIKVKFDSALYKSDDVESVDIYEKLMNNDNIYFTFYGTKGDEYRASYPLARLKEKYMKLK